MSDQIVNYIKKEFQKKTKKNDQYSIRAFAKSLKADSSTLSKILPKFYYT